MKHTPKIHFRGTPHTYTKTIISPNYPHHPNTWSREKQHVNITDATTPHTQPNIHHMPWTTVHSAQHQPHHKPASHSHRQNTLQKPSLRTHTHRKTQQITTVITFTQISQPFTKHHNTENTKHTTNMHALPPHTHFPITRAQPTKNLFIHPDRHCTQPQLPNTPQHTISMENPRTPNHYHQSITAQIQQS